MLKPGYDSVYRMTFLDSIWRPMALCALYFCADERFVAAERFITHTAIPLYRREIA